MAIVKLSAKTASSLRAGQLVTSLSSVIKELLENSLDAGSSAVFMTIEGLNFTIQDNGCGIAKEDFPLVGQEGCTSKTQNGTYGFRGEALSKLRVSSNLTISTRTSRDEIGSTLNLQTGVVTPCCMPPGTEIVVKELFHSYPIRKSEALKNLRAEIRTAIETVRTYSLATDAVLSLVEKNAGRTSLLYKSFGKTTEEKVKRAFSCTRVVELTEHRLHCYLMMKTVTANLYLFVNRRPVKVPSFERVFKHLQGATSTKFSVVLFLELDVLDANTDAHKSEVIAEELEEYAIVTKSLLVNYLKRNCEVDCLSTPSKLIRKETAHTPSSTNSVLSSTNSILKSPNSVLRSPSVPTTPLFSKTKTPTKKPLFETRAQPDFELERSPLNNKTNTPTKNSILSFEKIQVENEPDTTDDSEQSNSEENLTTKEKAPLEENTSERSTPFKLFAPPLNDSKVMTKEELLKLRVVGQFNSSFIVCSLEESIVVVDQHAADEIRNYEELMKKSTKRYQPLIEPIVVSLTGIQIEELSIYEEKLKEFGFKYETCEEGIRFDSILFVDGIAFTEKELLDFVCELKEGGAVPPKLHAAVASKACRGSIMVGDVLGYRQMEKIVRNLSLLEKPWNCPHGRPVLNVYDVSRTEAE